MYVYILCQKSNENHGIMLKRYLSYLRSCYCISPLRKKQVGANQQNYDEKELRHYPTRRTELGASFFAFGI